MRQPGGIGTKVEWHEPADYVESLFGFRRYFTLENQICKALFTLAEDPPKRWQGLNIKVVRRDREQSACGALRSALFAAAFAVQAANMRAAGNHVIQSSGAQLCKMLQRRLWNLQPSGINRWRIQPLNVHDEIMCPTVSEKIPEVRQIVKTFINDHKKDVPLLEIDWSDKLTTWADK
jgi:DNA polymerase I-like protein with 3'-5' exonuclease and polymerase domains